MKEPAMMIDFSLPPEELAADFSSLEAALRNDADGAKARILMRYFEGTEVEMRTLHLRSNDFAKRNMAALLAEAFGAMRRVVPAAWEGLHGRELGG